MANLKGHLWWKITPREEITGKNIAYILHTYGQPPKWWVEKYGPPPEPENPAPWEKR